MRPALGYAPQQQQVSHRDKMMLLMKQLDESNLSDIQMAALMQKMSQSGQSHPLEMDQTRSNVRLTNARAGMEEDQLSHADEWNEAKMLREKQQGIGAIGHGLSYDPSLLRRVMPKLLEQAGLWDPSMEEADPDAALKKRLMQ